MSTIFTRIVNREIPAHIIAEDDRFLAFLDISPLKAGHTLVIPKQEIDYIFEVPDALLGDMMVFAKAVAKKIEKVISCTRIGICVIGIEVPHAHIHLIPMNSVSDMNFARPKLSLSAEEMASIAERIRQA
jgi:histidine triad (HIT) family protein